MIDSRQMARLLIAGVVSWAALISILCLLAAILYYQPTAHAQEIDMSDSAYIRELRRMDREPIDRTQRQRRSPAVVAAPRSGTTVFRTDNVTVIQRRHQPKVVCVEVGGVTTCQ